MRESIVFSEKVIHEMQNFKNVALTLARRHQKMVACHLDAASFFKPELQVHSVKSALLSSFPGNIQDFVQQRYGAHKTVLLAASIIVDGIKYVAGMVVSVGSCAGLPEFRQIKQLLIINTDAVFICRPMIAWYHEHFRAYELTQGSVGLTAILMADFNDVLPLSAYKLRGKWFVSPKRYIFC